MNAETPSGPTAVEFDIGLYLTAPIDLDGNESEDALTLDRMTQL